VNVAVLNGWCLPGAGRSFFARAVGHEKSKPSPSRMKANVSRGREGSQPMKSHRWMMTGNPCSLVSEVAGIMIASMWRMLSDMRKGR
jgi:hypothetical protein